jgi:hypothetical protein
MKLEVVVEPSGRVIISLSQSVHFGWGHIRGTREATMKLALCHQSTVVFVKVAVATLHINAMILVVILAFRSSLLVTSNASGERV